jgi:glucan phosphoethanolaminetransferase (alkaline phosphatase superfamily)
MHASPMALFAWMLKAFVCLLRKMIKWFLYIVLLMISVPRFLSAHSNSFSNKKFYGTVIPAAYRTSLQHDTTTKAKQRQQEEDKKKIKEVAKAKKQPKPEKVEEIDPATGKPKAKPKRQRRPDGMERPPEIPRRNNN